MNLTTEQIEAALQGEHVHLVLPNAKLVVLSEDVYARLVGLLCLEDYDPDEGLDHINEIMAEDDANDPLLDSYQKYAP